MSDSIDSKTIAAGAESPQRTPDEPPSARSSLNLAAKLREALLNTRIITAAGRLTPRAGVAVGALLLALLVFLHVNAQDSGVKRHADVLAQLAAVKLIDARWDVAVLRSRSDPRAPSEGVVQSRDLTRTQRALDAALAQARSSVLRSSIAGLKNAYAEKAQLITRFLQASADSRQALDAAMRADATVSGLVRGAWRDFPQRERLVAAENLVARVLAEAQQYHHAPNAAHRTALESAAADLPRAHSLPSAVEAGLTRLESDVHQVLLLKPLEQMLGERLTVLDTGARADDLAETFQRDLADATARRSGYQTTLVLYSALLLILAVYVGLRAYRRYRELEVLYSEQTEALAALEEQVRPEGDAESSPSTEDAAKPSANVTFIRRPGPSL